MAVTLWEKWSSPDTTDEIGGRNASATITYGLEGTENEILVRNLVKASAAQFYQNLKMRSLSTKRTGVGIWEVKVRYAFPDDNRSEEPPETGDNEFSFDTTGGTQHISVSFETEKYPASAADHKNSIGVNNGAVEGVDIVIPQLSFVETHYFPSSFVTTSWLQSVKCATGKVNSGGFRGFSAKEVLFLGASGQKRGRGDWQVTFSFAVSENKTGLSFGDISGVAKKGHEYLWVAYKDEKDASANELTKVPKAVYVETVYESVDFSTMGI